MLLNNSQTVEIMQSNLTAKYVCTSVLTLQEHIIKSLKEKQMEFRADLPFKDEAQTALFKDPVRTAL